VSDEPNRKAPSLDHAWAILLEEGAGRRSTIQQLPSDRLSTSPVNQDDLEDRTIARVISSNGALARQLIYEDHVNRLESRREWERLRRGLVLCAGILGVGAAAACLHKFLGLPLAPTTEMTAGGIVAAGGGVTARTLASVLRRGGRRHQRDRDSSSP
jgi:hypothetical protein